jgi:N-acetylmuramoyl-L-alanine amidase
MEKTLTLKVARGIEASLSGRADLRVLLTRTDDFTLSLDGRKKLANTASPGVFVSLHFAGAPSPAVTGSRVFVLAAPRVSGSSALIPEEEAHGANLEEAWRLATVLTEELASLGPAEPARIAPVPLAPLLGITLPSVLLELDSLSSETAPRWGDPAVIEAAAGRIAAGLERYIAADVSLDRSAPRGNNPPP